MRGDLEGCLADAFLGYGWVGGVDTVISTLVHVVDGVVVTRAMLTL